MTRFAYLAVAAVVTPQVRCDESAAIVDMLTQMEQRIVDLESALGHVQGVLKTHMESYMSATNGRMDALEASCASAEESWGVAKANATCAALDEGELKGAITQ